MSTDERKVPHRFLTNAPEILKNAFVRKRFTVNFPAEHVPFPEGFRSIPYLPEPELCIACGSCVRVCPTHCITLEIFDDENKRYHLTFDYAQCMNCMECVTACNKDAIKNSESNEWMLGTTNKESLIRPYEVSRPVRKKPAAKEASGDKE